MADQSSGQTQNPNSKQTLSEQLSVRFAEETSKTVQRTKPRPAPLNLPTDIELTRQDSVKRSPFITPQNSIQPMDLNKKMAEIMNDGCYTGLGNPVILENKYGENMENNWENDNTWGAGDLNDFSIPTAVNEAGSFPQNLNYGMDFAKTPGNTHFPSAIGEPVENTQNSDLSHGAEEFRPRLNTQKSVYTEIAMDLHEQIKDVLNFDDNASQNSDSGSISEQINVGNESYNQNGQFNQNNTDYQNQQQFGQNASEINVDLGSMFPTPKTDLQEVNNMKIPQMPRSPRGGSNSTLANLVNPGSENPAPAPEPVSAVGVIADNEVDKLVKSEGRGEKSWMTPDILHGIEERDRLFSEMKAAPYDKAIEMAYKKKRNQVVTLTRRAKRELKNKIRPGVEENIKLQIKKQVVLQGAAAVGREVEMTAQNILSNVNSGRNTPNVRHQSGGPQHMNHPNNQAIAGNNHLSERLHPNTGHQGGGYHMRSHSNPQMAHLHPMSQTQRLSNPGSGHSSPSRFANVHRQPMGPPDGAATFQRQQVQQVQHVQQVEQRTDYQQNQQASSRFQQQQASQVQVPTVQLAPPQGSDNQHNASSGSWSQMLKK